jgi:NTP pyrophosphatase (non-canonical NTP hydrolase)
MSEQGKRTKENIRAAMGQAPKELLDAVGKTGLTLDCVLNSLWATIREAKWERERWRAVASDFRRMRDRRQGLEDWIRQRFPSIRIPAKLEPRPSLGTLERDIHDWEQRNFPDTPAYRRVLGATEELGELADSFLTLIAALGRIGVLSHGLLKMEQKIRGDSELHKKEMQDAIGDVVIYLINLCAHFGWSFEEIVFKTWEQVKKRNWVANPEEGTTGDQNGTT